MTRVPAEAAKNTRNAAAHRQFFPKNQKNEKKSKIFKKTLDK